MARVLNLVACGSGATCWSSAWTSAVKYADKEQEGAMPAHVVIGLAAAMQDACPPHGCTRIRCTAFVHPGWVAPVRLWHHSIQRLRRGGCGSPALQ